MIHQGERSCPGAVTSSTPLNLTIYAYLVVVKWPYPNPSGAPIVEVEK